MIQITGIHQVSQGSIVVPPVVGGPENGLAGIAKTRRTSASSVLTRRRYVTMLCVLLAASAVVFLLCLHVGPQPLGLTSLGHAVKNWLQTGQVQTDFSAVILLQVRLPRIVLAFLVGSCLAMVGASLQALLRNPLADPFVLGISSGASLGVALGSLWNIGSAGVGLLFYPLCGFAGALLALFIVYHMALTRGRLPLLSLIFAGMIVNATGAALVMFVTSIMDPNRSFIVMTWLMGSFIAYDWSLLCVVTLCVLVGGTWLACHARALNLLSGGEEAARTLGVDTEGVKRSVFVMSALLTGAVVSVSGVIGFVGMMVPHAVRLTAGADHRLLLPASALVGGMVLMGADAISRTVVAPAELPVGVVTALVGGPLFIYLLGWKKDRLI